MWALSTGGLPARSPNGAFEFLERREAKLSPTPAKSALSCWTDFESGQRYPHSKRTWKGVGFPKLAMRKKHKGCDKIRHGRSGRVASFGDLGGSGATGGVKHEAVQNCGGVVWSI